MEIDSAIKSEAVMDETVFVTSIEVKQIPCEGKIDIAEL